MDFVHPQFQIKNLKEIIESFFKKPDFEFLEKHLSLFFPEKNFVFTDMGRTAFKIIIDKLNLKKSQILMPAFICDIFWPILKAYQIEPIFLDIDLATFHLKIDEIKKKITERTKAILICHTFGLPVNIEKIYFELQTISLSKPIIIEDCAHAFGAKFRDIFVGNFGTTSFFSLYKQFPTLRGGLLIFPKDWKVKLKKTHFNWRDFFSLLNSFPLFAFFFKKYTKEIAPRFLRKEKTSLPAGINDFSLNIFTLFLANIENFLEERKKKARFYHEKLKSLGFEMQEGDGNVFCYLSGLMPKNLSEKRDLFVEKLRKEKVFVTRIWKDPIIFHPEVKEKLKIKIEEFPNTFDVARRIINFPLQNFYTQADIEKIIFKIKKTLSSIS